MPTPIQFIGKSKFLNSETRLKLRKALITHSKNKKYEIEALTYVFVNDEYLLELNRSSLNHDTYTDIITFDLSDKEGTLDGEIYISIDRVRENAKTFNVDFLSELTRVIGHGYLHLIGYKDKTKVQQEEMRRQEDLFIALFYKM